MYVRCERSAAILEGSPGGTSEQMTLGPFEWVQLTYNEIRFAPDGDFLGFYEDGAWYLHASDAKVLSVLNDAPLGPHDLSEPFSDIVIYKED